jgi:hypothetical protein
MHETKTTPLTTSSTRRARAATRRAPSATPRAGCACPSTVPTPISAARRITPTAAGYSDRDGQAPFVA